MNLLNRIPARTRAVADPGSVKDEAAREILTQLRDALARLEERVGADGAVTSPAVQFDSICRVSDTAYPGWMTFYKHRAVLQQGKDPFVGPEMPCARIKVAAAAGGSGGGTTVVNNSATALTVHSHQGPYDGGFAGGYAGGM